MKLTKTYSILLFGILLFAGCSNEGSNTGSSPGVDPVSISISPSNPALAPGMTLQMSAVGSNSDGTLRDLTAAVNWTSSDDTIIQDTIKDLI